MDIPLQITFRDLAHSEALEARIRQYASKLEHAARDIHSCRVTVEELDRHKQSGRQFMIRLDIRARDHEIAVNRQHDEDVYVALHEAFDAAKRQLERLNEN